MKQLIAVLSFIYYTTLLATAFYGSDKLKFRSVREIQPSEILNPYTHCSMPYIVRGAASNCPGMNFTFEYLLKKYQDTVLHLYIDRSKRQLSDDPSWEDGFNVDYVDDHDIGNLRYIKIKKDIGYINLNANEIDNDNSFLLDKEFSCFPPNAMFNDGTVTLLLGTGKWMSMHAHPSHDSYLIEFRGPKMIILAPPTAAYAIMTRPGSAKMLNELDCCYDFSYDHLYLANIDIKNPCLENHPELAEIIFYEAIIQEGDVLFIPAKWLHEVHYRCEDECIGINQFVQNCNPCLP